MKKLFLILKNLFKKKPSLRELYIEKYGQEFGEIYDNMSSGIPVGNFYQTTLYLDMITQVKKENNF